LEPETWNLNSTAETRYNPTEKRSPLMSEPIGRLDHLAFAVHSIEKARPFFENALGAKFRYIKVGRGGGFRYAVYDLYELTIEVLEAIEPNNFVATFLAKRGEGVHHMTLQTPGLHEKVIAMEGQGLRIVDKQEENDRVVEAFISPRSGCGLLFQLAEDMPALNNEPYWEKK
jgi:methylmalonyl-CoA epimerase